MADDSTIIADNTNGGGATDPTTTAVDDEATVTTAASAADEEIAEKVEAAAADASGTAAASASAESNDSVAANASSESVDGASEQISAPVPVAGDSAEMQDAKTPENAEEPKNGQKTAPQSAEAQETAPPVALPGSSEASSALAEAATPGKRKEAEASDGAQSEEAGALKKQKTAERDAVKTEEPPAPAATPTPATSVAAAKEEPQVAETASSALAAPIMISRDDMAKMEEDGGLVKFDVITNDGAPEHLIQLTTLKNIFARQLPKMPKEYIVRLVFDRNHRSMVILKNGTHVIGGICYRPFLPNHFAEIAFCAINAADQVKGYGTRLMNHLKEHVKHDGITHFLTYADNYAIGYFKKQGFAKVVSMPRPNWFGYIKDYDGGTLMDAACVACVQAIQDKVKERSRAHIVYPGLEKFAEGRLMDIYMIPGVKEAGWSQATIRNNRIGTRDPGSLKTQLTQLWKAVASHRSAWPFHEPVDTTIVVDYLEFIKDPVDLSLVAKRIESGQYVSKAALRADLDLMCNNCMAYNTPDTNYYKAAKDLQEFIERRVQIRDGPAAKS
ncbi:hypothetical protein PybrP1_005885 [[Pythium] brassicae (nom. inval.)]|nr:hypothetical protein PybrP1_005885 [[Pythium] brassicae (nom. inval.)]